VDAVLTMRRHRGWRMVRMSTTTCYAPTPSSSAALDTPRCTWRSRGGRLPTFYGAAGRRSRPQPLAQELRYGCGQPPSRNRWGQSDRTTHSPGIRPGEAEGRLLGGCTTLLLASPPLEVDFRAIVFEDIGEEPYRMDNT
jgi:hypothetical protein